MKIDILTLFPEMFKGPFDESILRQAQDKSLVKIEIHNLRDWAEDKRKTVDDRPYGGGTGMILMIKPIYHALRELKTPALPRVILLSPTGKVFNQNIARRLAKEKHLIFICGHYEGVDDRVREHLIDEEISIGDYILTGGELPAMVVVDTIVRLIPGVLEKPKATQLESFSNSKFESPLRGIPPECRNSKLLLEYPQYTRPASFKGWKVPEVLLSGDHKKIEEWRKKKALETTKKLRPDLLH